jgi:methionyl-tRNA formyltransferase
VQAVLTDATRDVSGASSVATRAAELGIDVRDAALVRDPELGRWLRARSIDLFLNVHSLHIVDASVLEAAAIGSFNLHPGPLPGFGGLNAPSWGIYEGETTWGSTVHWMDPIVDAGPIAYETRFPVEDGATGLTLTARCVREGISLLGRLLDDAAIGGRSAIPRLEQPTPVVDRGSGPPDGARIPWSLPAARIEALIRACDYGPFPSPWGRAKARVGDTEVGVIRASPLAAAAPDGAVPGEVVEVDDGGAIVVAGERTLLRLTRLELDGRVVDPTTVMTPDSRMSA